MWLYMCLKNKKGIKIKKAYHNKVKSFPLV